MTGTFRHGAVTWARTAMLVLGAAGGLMGCGALDVSDPTAVEEEEVDNAAGAEMLRGAALRLLAEAADDGALLSGTFTDEFLFDPPSWAVAGGLTLDQEVLDRRDTQRLIQMGYNGAYEPWHELRSGASVAAEKFRAYAAPGVMEAKVGEMLALRGYATLRLAEDYCPGFSLSDVVDFEPVIGSPLSTEEALARALADFDSAVVSAADSARILRLARIGRARTLLALGRLDEAGATVTDVPTEYVANIEYRESAAFLGNRLAFPSWLLERGVADNEGGNGLDFVSADDPRVETELSGMAADGVTGIYRTAKYPTADAPLVLASGIEARLIEAEAALQSGGDWLGILNALRTTCADAATCPDPAPAGSGGVAGLPPLTDPGTAEAQLGLLFRERAFWLFATGHRLADLRRLVRVYNRPADSVFPAGAHRLGASYATGTSLPFNPERDAQHNPAVTGCTAL